ncbi:MAG: hypothetical protein MUO26_15325 [Methanotrichaceae archaeon]|nr:hypothetical protein [Methanotrichaceae archaeon]
MKLTIMQFGLLGIFAALVVLIVLVLGTYDQNETVHTKDIDTANAASEKSYERKRMLVPISDVSGSDILIDISENSTKHIMGSSVVPYTNFTQDDESPKSWLEISNILSRRNIS